MSLSSIPSSSTPSQPSAPIKISEATPIKVSVPAATAKSSAAQEATETPDVTRKEAAKGDQQAIKLLAKEAAASQTQGGKPGLNIKA